MVAATENRSSSNPPHRHAGALDRLLKRICRTQDFPTISKYVIDINQKLAVDPDSSNAADLANVILKDHSLTSKLLKMVNSAFYGLAAGKVGTVTRAVVILGYENVRLATLSLAMFEHFSGQPHSRHLKEAIVGSFWSGIVARNVATMQGGADPEEAFICAMMSHLGKLVMIYYLPDEYLKICRTMVDDGVRESKAVRSVCGVGYGELGAAVARQWNFAPQIHESMQPLCGDERQNKKKPPQPIRVITSFVKELCDTIETDPSAVDPKSLHDILERYRPQIKLSKKQLKTLVKDSLESVHQHAQALSLDVGKSAFLERLFSIYDPGHRTIAAFEIPGVPEPAGQSFHLKNESQLKADARFSTTRNPEDMIMDGIQEISQIMMTDYEVDTIAVMSLEILYRALDFQRALMFVKDGNSKKIAARFGYGRTCQSLVGHLSFRLGSSKDLFNLSIQVGKDLVVADSYAEKTNHLIPGWYRRQINAPSFVFMPVILQQVCIGALYADRNIQGPPITESEHRYMGMLRNQLILSIKYRQTSA